MSKPKTQARTKHKAGCPVLNGNPVNLVADHNRKMMICDLCAVPDGTPAMAKNAYKLMGDVEKVVKAIKAKAKRVEAKAAPVAANPPAQG